MTGRASPTQRGLAGHERGWCGHSDEWLTPPMVLAALGPFDLDPASPVQRPWSTAATHYTLHEDGLSLPWIGRVWLNPPYGPQVQRWLTRLAEHGDGIALVFARTETRWFTRLVWDRADAARFLSGRLRFHDVRGRVSTNNAGSGSVLVAYGPANAAALRDCGLPGRYVPLHLRERSSP